MPDQEKRYFFTILLTDKYLQSSLVSNNGQGIQIQEFSEIKTYFDRQDLLTQLDKSLQQLGPDSQDIVETIFVFDYAWLENGELSDLKKPIVKEISEELSLDALGQISIPEALAEARLIGDENDSCLLLVFKEDSFDLIFLKHGQFLDLITVGRSGNVVDDFTEVLARAAKHLDQEGKYFPNKVLLTSIALKPKAMESLHEQLVKVDWTSNPGFAQAPTIVILEADYMIKSASLSAGKIFTKEAFLAKMPQVEFVAKSAPMNPTITTRPTAPSPEVHNPNDYAIEKPSVSSFGINLKQDYLTKKDNLATPSSTKQTLDIDKGAKTRRSSLVRFYLAHKKTILLGFATGLLALLIIASIFAFFISKVKIVLTPEETLLQKSVLVTLDPNLEDSDFSKALLKASLHSKEISGQDVAATTGIGLVGDKAKGKVLVYNKTLQEAELKQGTIISSNGIDFLLDSTIKIPAAVEKEEGDEKVRSYGKIETTVTAKDIGAEANFNKDTKFRVADYFDDQFAAVALDNFSGGSSREVRVVAEIDQNKLLENLSKKLVEEANREFEQESGNGTYFVPTGKTKIIKNSYSSKVGDEAETVTLDLTLQVMAVQYLAADLKKLALDILAADLPTNYSFTSQDPSLMTDEAKIASNSSRVTFNADLSAKAAANLNLEELKQTVLGKSWVEAKESLENSDEIKEVQIIFNPPFLINILRNLPSDQDRVSLELDK